MSPLYRNQSLKSEILRDINSIQTLYFLRALANKNPIQSNPKMGNITVFNETTDTIWVFVSKYSTPGGDDSWFPISPGGKDVWVRDNWELVAVKNADDTRRLGAYMKTNSYYTISRV